MAETRIKVADEKEFDEREWLRREVLWASLMAPYPDQMEGWFNGLEFSHHLGNSSRQRLYSEIDTDPQSQSQAFFNQGKVIGAILSSATLFRAQFKKIELQQLYDNLGIPNRDTLALQAQNVDMVLGNIKIDNLTEPLRSSDEEAYSCTEKMARLADRSESPFAKRRLFLRAGKIMSRLAMKEVSVWKKTAEQNNEGSLPDLTIPDGGHPRSAGPRVEMLQPVFNEIVESDEFQRL
jgi:hypothetical protein